MRGYLVATVEITDPEGFGRYGEAVSPLVARHGGRYLIRGGEAETREGAPMTRRQVVIEFPSMEAARAFYDDPDYAPVRAMRFASASTNLALVPGI